MRLPFDKEIRAQLERHAGDRETLQRLSRIFFRPALLLALLAATLLVLTVLAVQPSRWVEGAMLCAFLVAVSGYLMRISQLALLVQEEQS